jgi:hypothetical protein
MMLHHGKVDKAIRIAEEGSDSSLKAHCYWLKAQQLLSDARKNKKNAKDDVTKVMNNGIF